MKYDITTPPTEPIATWPLLKYHCQVTDDVTEGTDDTETPSAQEYLMGLLDSATAYAEDKMETSILQRTITATFYPEDIFSPGSSLLAGNVLAGGLSGLDCDETVWLGVCAGSIGATTTPIRSAAAFRLPRGPVASITSVSDGRGDTLDYVLERVGTTDRLKIKSHSFHCPVTVVYVAGLAATPADVPPMIKQCILQHTRTLFDYRGAISDRPMFAVPNHLDAFYKNRSRNSVMG